MFPNDIYKDLDKLKKLSNLIQEKFSCDIESKIKYQPKSNEIKVIFINYYCSVTDDAVDNENILPLNFFREFKANITKAPTSHKGGSNSIVTFNQNFIELIIDRLNQLPNFCQSAACHPRDHYWTMKS